MKACVKNPKKIQKSVCFRFSTGTKSSKTAQKIFQKTVKMYLVPATNLKNKKNLRFVAGTVYGLFRYLLKKSINFNNSPF
jgi:hypothetical protein